MAVQRIADMTLEELNQLIDLAVERRLRLETALKPKDARAVEDILASLDRHRWTPPPGAKTSLELLREDRDA